MEYEGWLFFANGLIRSVLHFDPHTLTDEMWATQVKVAESLQNMFVGKIGKLLG